MIILVGRSVRNRVRVATVLAVAIALLTFLPSENSLLHALLFLDTLKAWLTFLKLIRLCPSVSLSTILTMHLMSFLVTRTFMLPLLDLVLTLDFFLLPASSGLSSSSEKLKIGRWSCSSRFSKIESLGMISTMLWVLLEYGWFDSITIPLDNLHSCLKTRWLFVQKKSV